jgi:hypothetical protein
MAAFAKSPAFNVPKSPTANLMAAFAKSPAFNVPAFLGGASPARGRGDRPLG